MESDRHPERNLKRRRLWCWALLFCALPAPAQSPDSTGEFWPEIDAFLKLNDKSRIFLMYSATRPESLRAYADGQTGIHLDLYGIRPLRKRLIDLADESRSKSLMIRTGYLFSRPRNNSGASVEHIATTEATGRAHLRGGLLLSDRNRLDLRWVDGNPRHRYRNRLKLERTFKTGPFELTPYAHGEVFYEFRTREWSRLRYAAGAEWAITRRITLEVYYLRQNTWDSVPQFVNAAGLALQFYLR